VVRLLRYLVVDDFGRVLNPLLVEGQVHGGLAQGIGQALLEQAVYDSESGQLLTGSFLDYCLPRADDLPDFEVGRTEVPCTTNALGVKGCGEAGAMGAPPAVMSAVRDALAPLGIEDIAMPATPLRVWQSIDAARRKAGG
jgi:carbon-monoxide dehydrogenase large subunit